MSRFLRFSISLLNTFVLLSLPQISFSLQDVAEETCILEESDGTCHGVASQKVKLLTLAPMTYDLGKGEETYHAYITPDISAFYKKFKGSLEIIAPKFNGQAAKFINMSPEILKLMWDPGNGDAPALIAETNPFTAAGAGTFPGHQFFFVSDDNEKIRYRFVVDSSTNIYVYDSYASPNEENEIRLKELKKTAANYYRWYRLWKDSLLFSWQYKQVTGRDYLSRFPRDPPMHHMWAADYFGQTHVVQTNETHFSSLPPEPMLQRELPHEGETDKQVCK